AFRELSMSRLGYLGDRELADAVFQNLKERGLARDSADGMSIPMHPAVRTLVLVLLAQILRPQGARLGAELNPATDQPELVDALCQLMGLNRPPTESAIVSFDLATVGVDLGPIPINEVLDFRLQHEAEHRRY